MCCYLLSFINLSAQSSPLFPSQAIHFLTDAVSLLLINIFPPSVPSSSPHRNPSLPESHFWITWDFPQKTLRFSGFLWWMRCGYLRLCRKIYDTDIFAHTLIFLSFKSLPWATQPRNGEMPWCTSHWNNSLASIYKKWMTCLRYHLWRRILNEKKKKITEVCN